MSDSHSAIYLDHAATTPLRDEVREAMRPYEADVFGNPSSVHRWGQSARAALEEARERLAAVIGASRGEIVFTSGGTESDNLAVLGLWRRHGAPGRWIAHSAVEHSAVRGAAEQAAREGAGRQVLGVDGDALLDLGALDEALALEPVLVSVMWVNNEVGTIQPVEQVGQRCTEAGVPFHTDAVQALGRVPVSVERAGCGTLAVSGHKIGAPRGVGALYVRRGVRLDALLFGGGQEDGIRSGTQNVAAAVGLAVAAELAEAEREAEAERLAALRDELATAIVAELPTATVNAAGAPRAPHILNVTLPGVARETALMVLDMEGVAASGGSACSSGSVAPSPVLTAMGVAPEHAAIRLSLGRTTRAHDVREAKARLARALRRGDGARASAAPTPPRA